MRPSEPPEEGIFTKILVFGALAVLLLILVACAFFIYGFVNPSQDDPVYPTPTPLPTHTTVITSTPTPTPVITPTPKPVPTLQIEPTPEATPAPVIDYQFDTRVTDGIKISTPPGIWSRYIVYDELIGDNNFKIHIYDLKSLGDTVIATGNVRSNGAVGAGKVALLYGDDNTIKLYDLESKATQVITPAKNFPRAFPNVFGDYVVYTGYEGGYNIFSLYAFRLSDGLNSMWAVNVPEPREPRGYDNYIVWWDIANGKKELILYDIKKISSKTIGEENCDHPRIYDQYVIYHGPDHHIYLYDISSGKSRKIVEGGRQYSADIYGSKIVYDDNRNGNWDIYSFDLSTGKETQITNEPHDQMSPQIYGDNVLYMDNRNSLNGNWDIYTIRI